MTRLYHPGFGLPDCSKYRFGAYFRVLKSNKDTYLELLEPEGSEVRRKIEVSLGGS